MSEHVLRSHNKTLLLYHIVCPAKYRKKVFGKEVVETLKETCRELGEAYEIHFVEIGADENHVHFMVQSIPSLSVSRIVTIVKSITARQIFFFHEEVRKILWGGKFWTSGYYANTVGHYANERVIQDYVQKQGKTYERIYRGQLKLFDDLV